MSDDAALGARIKALALARGFVRVGFARAEPLTQEAVWLQSWLDAGHHGGMDYMERTAEVRVDPGHPGMLPSARSVIALVAELPSSGSAAGSPVLSPGRVARYAHGRDYHNVLRRKMRPLIRLIDEAGHAARGCIDAMPVLERAWAQRAGVGFIGKNCCLIVPGVGSHVLLATIVTSAVLAPDAPMAERCGACVACLEACPTRAFVAARSLDARRCISYLTIEHRGAIDPELRAPMGDWLFGCDACQDVCPYNRAGAKDREPMPGLARERGWHALRAEQLLQLDTERWQAAMEGTPLRRPGFDGMRRNAAIALGNAGDRRALPVLRETAQRDESEVVRESAAWAIARIAEREPG